MMPITIFQLQCTVIDNVNGWVKVGKNVRNVNHRKGCRVQLLMAFVGQGLGDEMEAVS